jgi:hypothetical protein
MPNETHHGHLAFILIASLILAIIVIGGSLGYWKYNQNTENGLRILDMSEFNIPI